MTPAEALAELDTPLALIDRARLRANIARMQRRMDELGVRLRPHVKTSKCLPVVRSQLAAGGRGVTVSTLKEAEQLFAAGVDDILYAVGMVPAKLPRALALRRRGCRLSLLTDNVECALAIGAFGREQHEPFEVWIEIDTDGHRSGLRPEDPALLEVGRALHAGGLQLGGVMTHAGASYGLSAPDALCAMAEQERAGCVRAAERLREGGLACPGVSVGSTPTALSAARLDGVSEVRAGVYVFFDLVMANVGVCDLGDIALSVLTTVIGHQAEKGWAIVDAGWMALSRDRGTQGQRHDYGYGQVCALDGTPLPGYVVSDANQEHGILSRAGAPDDDIRDDIRGDIRARLPLGTRLRILPNHACATGAQFAEYRVLTEDGRLERWERFQGW